MLESHQKQGVVNMKAVGVFRCQAQPLTRSEVEGEARREQSPLLPGVLFALFGFVGHIVPTGPRAEHEGGSCLL